MRKTTASAFLTGAIWLLSIRTYATNPTLVVAAAVDCSSIARPIALTYDPYNGKLLIGGDYTDGSSATSRFFSTPYDNVGNPFTSFGPWSGISDEPYIVVAQSTVSGFQTGQVFVADCNYAGAIDTAPPDGSSESLFATLPTGESVSDAGLWFDVAISPRTSANRLYVSTISGNVYGLDYLGGTHLLLSDPNGIFECITTISNNPTLYGPMSGKVVACDWVNAVLYMISPTPPYSYTTAALQWSDGTLVRAERILPIPGNPMDFWFVDFTNNRLLKIDQFPQALKGAILLITELPNTVYYNGDYHTTHFWTLRYSGGALQLEPLLVTHNGTELSTQIEGAAFVPH